MKNKMIINYFYSDVSEYMSWIRKFNFSKTEIYVIDVIISK